jgi:hypothetical protein
MKNDRIVGEQRMGIGPSHDDAFLEEPEPVLEEGWLDERALGELPGLIKGEQRRKLTSRRSIEEHWERKRLRSLLEDVYSEEDKG